MARILYYSKDIESFGTGLKRIADACENAGVRYEFVTDNFGFTVIFYRPPLWTSDRLEDNLAIASEEKNGLADKDINGNVDKDVNEDVVRDVENTTLTGIKAEIVRIMKKNSKISAKQLSGSLGINMRNVQKHITTLKKQGIIERIGSPKGGHWIVK